MGKCSLCGSESNKISGKLGVCLSCIRESPEKAIAVAEKVHAEARKKFGLPPRPPKTSRGIRCTLCANECIMGEGEVGFCGLRKNLNGKLYSLSTSSRAIIHAYKDPHITNCCAAWFCPAGTGAGHPRFAYKDGPEYGYYNYAVFFYGCNFSCLYCQNYSHKAVWQGHETTVEEFMVDLAVNRDISCICYFGGSPEPSLPFAIQVSREVRRNFKDRIIRICFEWNGCGNSKLVERATELALESGGNIKFDIKCFDENLNKVLSGTSNSRAYENFKLIAKKFYDERADLPVLTATTLLVPGYVDELEVGRIANFIADLNPDIPYGLLIFYPQFVITDLPATPLEQVLSCYKIAKEALRKVHVGNLHLIGLRSMSDLERVANKSAK